MEIRPYTFSDLPQVLDLLKSSLGETSSPKTAAYWQWKHVDNPFGPSPVLLALDNGEPIGVRAFMRWHWQQGNHIHSTVRAVDTATHPGHQGKGIFKKLTFTLADTCQAAGDAFVFNTPNEQSKPGYLKMGWIEAGRLPVGFRLMAPSFGRGKVSGEHQQVTDPEDMRLRELCHQWNQSQAAAGKWFTPKSAAYLHWRYQVNPVQQYTVMQGHDHFMAVYPRSRGRITELRVSELLWRPAHEHTVRRPMKDALRLACKMHHAQLVTFAPVLKPMLGGLLSTIRPLGPMLTLRRLAAEESAWQTAKEIPAGNFQLGDLELF